ncbi:MAG: PilN domain-containing protein, partial [Rickettsiales bacterium]|nr:PilN domain-containing protein [Rickettsiales bacterium]
MEHIRLPEDIISEDQVSHHAKWAVPIGLAMRKLDPFDKLKGVLGSDNVNLLPDVSSFKKNERVSFITRTAAIATGMVLFLLLVGMTFWLESRESTLNDQLAALDGVELRHIRASGAVEKLQQGTGKYAMLLKLQKDLGSNQQQIISAYEHIYASLPKGVWLRELSFKGDDLEINGSALTDDQVLEFMRMLNQNSTFGNVTLRSMQAVRDKNNKVLGYKQFILVAQVAK